MIDFITHLRRDEPGSISKTTIGLLVALVVLIIVIGASVGALFYIRRRRRQARLQSALPMYNEKRLSSSSTSSAHRRVLVRPSESVLVYQEKKNLLENSTSPPNSPLPEIRITFPEEYDDSGKRTSGRVVVVRIGDSSFGLEPVSENLPAYHQTNSERFHSIDLERVGGLQEKAVEKQWS